MSDLNSFRGWMKGDEGAKVTSNFAAEFRSWGRVDMATVKQTSPKSLADMLAESNNDFVPLKAEAGYKNPVTGEFVTVDDGYMIYNPATGQPISNRVFTGGYNAMGYGQILQTGFGTIVEAGNVPTRIISWPNGRKIWVQFIVPEEFRAAGRGHNVFYGLSTSLDGSTATTLGVTIWTPVCSNTYAVGRKELSETGGYVRRTSGMATRITSVTAALGILREQVTEYMGWLNDLNGCAIRPNVADAFIAAMFPSPQKSKDGKREDGKRENDGPVNRQAELKAAIVATAQELDDTDLTAYHLFGGVTRWVSERQQNRNMAEQYEYVTTGPGAAKADEARNWLTANL